MIFESECLGKSELGRDISNWVNWAGWYNEIKGKRRKSFYILPVHPLVGMSLGWTTSS